MQAIFRIALLQHAMAIHQNRIVIPNLRLDFGSVTAQPLIESENIGGWPAVRLLVLGVVADRKQQAKHELDAMLVREFAHCPEIVLDHFESFGTRVARNVVRPGQNNHSRGTQINHVRVEPYQHLRSGLPANTTVHEWLAGKILRQFPTVGDRVTEENYAALLRRLSLKSRIVLMVAAELIPILQLVGKALRGELQAAICFGRLELRDQLP